MPMPKKFNRKTEPLKDLVAFILKKENYIHNDGELRPIKVALKTNSAAKYTRERLYCLFAAFNHEAGEAGLKPPDRPMIKQWENFLIFTWKENRGKVQWEVVNNDKERL